VSDGGSEPNYERAAKIANHELKGAIAYFRFAAEGIRVPMQALVDYCGFRLIGNLPPICSLIAF
jgi:hypothetical protein